MIKRERAWWAVNTGIIGLFDKVGSIFLQKQYNEMYPLISLIEDRTKTAG